MVIEKAWPVKKRGHFEPDKTSRPCCGALWMLVLARYPKDGPWVGEPGKLLPWPWNIATSKSDCCKDCITKGRKQHCLCAYPTLILLVRHIILEDLVGHLVALGGTISKEICKCCAQQRLLMQLCWPSRDPACLGSLAENVAAVWKQLWYRRKWQVNFVRLTEKTQSSKNMSIVALLIFTVLFLLKGILKEYMTYEN